MPGVCGFTPQGTQGLEEIGREGSETVLATVGNASCQALE